MWLAAIKAVWVLEAWGLGFEVPLGWVCTALSVQKSLDSTFAGHVMGLNVWKAGRMQPVKIQVRSSCRRARPEN